MLRSWGISGGRAARTTYGVPLGLEIPDPDPEKPEKLVSARFALLRPNQGIYRHGRGTHGSGLTPGSLPGVHFSGIPVPDPENPENPEKPEKPVATRFALLRPNQDTYRHGRGTHRSGLT